MKGSALVVLSVILIAGCVSQYNSPPSLKNTYENPSVETRFATLKEAYSSGLELNCTGARNDTPEFYAIYASNGRIRLETGIEDSIFIRGYIETVKNQSLPDPPRFIREGSEYVFLAAAANIVVTENALVGWKETKEKNYPNFNSTILRVRYAGDGVLKFLKRPLIGSVIVNLVCTAEKVPDSYFITPPWEGQ